MGENAAPAARKRIHQGRASLHWISCTILPAAAAETAASRGSPPDA
ncbi:MAG: hypothetical protein ACKOTB_01500 [Planctomycetia bacterium]